MALNPHAAPFVMKGSGGATASAGKSTIAAPKVYCDLDGCLVDFEKGCRAVFSGKNPSELTPKVMWGGLARAKGFCEFRRLSSVAHDQDVCILDDSVLPSVCCTRHVLCTL